MIKTREYEEGCTLSQKGRFIDIVVSSIIPDFKYKVMLAGSYLAIEGVGKFIAFSVVLHKYPLAVHFGTVANIAATITSAKLVYSTKTKG